MHEMSLAQSVAELIMQEMERHPGRELLEVEITVGERSGVEPDTFRTAMGAVIRTTPWPEADVTLITEKAEAECLMCGHRFRPLSPGNECPRCGSGACGVVAGMAFRLSSLRMR